MWLAWTIGPDPNSSDVEPDAALQMSTVSFQRLRELASRFQPNPEHGVNGPHQLIRFNLYNFGEQPVVVCAIGLPRRHGETLRCEVVPSIVVAAGARYPMMVEVMDGPVQHIAEIAVDSNGRRTWVATQSLPKL